MAALVLTVGDPASRWSADSLTGRWEVAFSQFSISHLSTQYVLIPVSATKAGAAYNPTSDTVQFAFMPTQVQQPVNADWQTGSWETVTSNILYPYNARCLVGPTGTINLNVGTYTIYLKIADNPETPVLTAGQLIVS